MRRIAMSGLVVLGVLSASTSGQAARARHTASTECPPGHSHLLVADAQAQVYEAFEQVYGCAYGHRRSYALGPPPEGSTPEPSASVEQETLAGPIVAYEENYISESLNRWFVVVRDLRTGRVLHKLPTGTPNPPSAQLVGDGYAVAIVVKSDGAVAWIVRTRIEPQPNEYQVRAVDKSGSRLLASGTAIDPSSLALAGSTLYWTQGGRPFSAFLN